MIKKQLEEDLKKAVEDLGYKTSGIVLSIPENLAFGDYSTNIALQLSKLKPETDKQSPREIASKIVEKLKSFGFAQDSLEGIQIAGPGFINFFIKDKVLLENLPEVTSPQKTKNPQKILAEYGHANILKEIHIGHLRTFILGESLSRILEYFGDDVFRANYQGDVGLHVAKALWGVEKLGLPKGELTLEGKAKFLGQAYALGNTDYDSDPAAKEKIDELNTAIYQKDIKIDPLYRKARQWSIDYFEEFYKVMGIKYDRCFFESEAYELGKKIVLENLSIIFQKSEGAVIFPGEKYGLHNRVFINSAGNPTYEAKEVGLAELEYQAFPYDKAIHIVGSEQAGYFAVVFKALELLFKHLLGKKYHLSYGMVGLKAGKMSSRTGNVVTVNDLLRVVSEKVKEVVKESRLEINDDVITQVTVGAIKFTYLKFSPSSNMVFDLDQSVSLQGDSGPYLQYTYARTRSVLRNAEFKVGDLLDESLQLEVEERSLLVRLEYFPSIIEQAALEYRPNLLCEYLLDLAKDFNLFYQKHRIIQSEKKELRLALTKVVGEALKKGLNLLGIDSPERM